MFVLDTLLIGSLRFVLDKVVAAAEAEMHDDSALRERLLEAQMEHELGEITDTEFADIERDVLARMRELKGSDDRGAISMSKGARVELESFRDEGKQ
jgi:hypothetical protein